MLRRAHRRHPATHPASRGAAFGAGLLLATLAGLTVPAQGMGLGPDDRPLPAAVPPPSVPATTLPGLESLSGPVLAALPRLQPSPRSMVRPAAGSPLAPIVSGLAWRSGASCAEAEFEAWRGRKLDVHGLFVWHDTWEQMIGRITSPYYRKVVKRSPQPVISLAMMPRSEFKQHAKCAAGAFDGYFRQFGTILKGIGAGHAIIRIGWEANNGSRSHPWGIDLESEIPDYIACFRREAAAIRSTAPDVKIEWTNAKASYLPVSVLKAYPGDSYVDVMGLHYYNVDTQVSSQADWDKLANSKRFGGPQGIKQWMRTAVRYGKKMGYPEWGVWAKEGTPEAADLPIYIQNMFSFFKTNAQNIAYENYYNCPAEHHIGPPEETLFPKSSALYQQLWKAGQ